MEAQNCIDRIPFRADELYEFRRVRHLEVGDARDLAESVIFRNFYTIIPDLLHAMV